MANPAWTKRAAAIERAENKLAHVIAIVRAVEVLGALAETDRERRALLDILTAVAQLKTQALTERKEA